MFNLIALIFMQSVMKNFLLLLLIVTLASACSSANEILQEKAPITKVEMKLVSKAGVKNSVITNKAQLDSIDNAFKNAKEINVQKGGAFDIWAEIKLYKGDNKIDFFIEHSPYNGWMIEINNKTLSSDYLFELVKRYARQ